MRYGSLVNLIEADCKSATPTVGMGATELMHSDRHPYTVIEVAPNGKRVKVQSDNAKRTDHNGLSESQTYEYSSDPNGLVVELRLGKDGRWHQCGCTSQIFSIGQREEYYDPSY